LAEDGSEQFTSALNYNYLSAVSLL